MRSNVRPARPEDAQAAAYLMFLSGPQIAQAVFGPRKEQACAVLEALFRGERHQFSHEHACVADLDGQVVGLALGTPGHEWVAIGEATGRELGGTVRRSLGLVRFTRMVRSLLALSRSFPSPEPEDYFVQMLAVLPQARRRGIGKLLMASMEARAAEVGARRLALDVLIENEEARRFYLALGFCDTFTVRRRALIRRFGTEGRIRMVRDR